MAPIAANLDWLFPAAAWTLAALGALALLWALFHDRARGRRRCPKCWYDMSATPGLVCPECGKDARREKRLFKTRRHSRWIAAAAALLLLAHGASITPRIRDHGWPGAVPTWFLAAFVPIDERDWLRNRAYFGGPLENEFLRRCTGGEVSYIPARLWAYRAVAQDRSRGRGHDGQFLIVYEVGEVLREVEERSWRNAGDYFTDTATSLIDADTWECNGGDVGQMRTLNRLLFVRATPRVQQQVERLLAAVRAARPGEPASADQDRWSRDWEVMETLDRARLEGPGPNATLEASLSAVTEAAGVPCLIHVGSMERGSPRLDRPLGLGSSRCSPADLLNDIVSRLPQWNCDWQVEDGHVVIYAWDENGETQVRVYDVTPQLDGFTGLEGQAQFDDLIRAITTTIDPEGWLDNGGSRGSIFPIGTRLLVIGTSARVHRRLELLLQRIEERLRERHTRPRNAP